METHNTHTTEKTGALPAGCRFVELKDFTDSRGSLCSIENADAPFNIERVFWIYNIAPGQERGKHAHRTCAELLFVVSGSFLLDLTDGRTAATVKMDTPSTGVLIPPGVWCKLHTFSPDCVCLCLAPQAYNREGYINDFDEFLKKYAQ